MNLADGWPGECGARILEAMQAFWKYARGMGRYPARLTFAMIFAFFGAGTLGLGFAGVLPIFKTILSVDEQGQAIGLPELARDLNEDLGENMITSAVGLEIPDEWIEQLPPKPYHAILWIMGGLGVLTVFGAATTFGHQYLSIDVVYRSVTDLRRDAYAKLIRLPLQDVVTSGTADPVSRVVGDTAAIASGFTALTSRGVFQVSRGLAMLIVAFAINARLTLISLIVAPFLAFIVRQLGGKIRKATRRALREQAALYGSAIDALKGLRVVKVHTTEGVELERFGEKNRQVMHQVFKARTARAASSPLVEVVTLCTLGTLFVVAGKAVLDNQLTVDELLGTLGALFICATALRPLTGIVNEIHQAGAAADRVDELMSTPEEPGLESHLPDLPRHEKTIRFGGVSFTYRGAETPSVVGLDLEVRFGERVAFVGPNGSGKTTLLSMVPRLFDPQEGSVLIDGQDVRGVSLASLRGQIGVVTQETVLFTGTIRSNIAYGAEGASEAQIREAAERAHAWSFIERLSGGLDTPVGESGLTLSGGQRQRIAIARAILRDPSILVLDEATSMIDADSEAQIAQALEEFSEGRTTLVVAHRLSTVVNADRIVVLDRGRLVDVGTHAELLERCGVYQTLAKTQLVGSA